jgi:hypothetical protein
MPIAGEPPSRSSLVTTPAGRGRVAIRRAKSTRCATASPPGSNGESRSDCAMAAACSRLICNPSYRPGGTPSPLPRVAGLGSLRLPRSGLPRILPRRLGAGLAAAPHWRQADAERPPSPPGRLAVSHPDRAEEEIIVPVRRPQTRPAGHHAGAATTAPAEAAGLALARRYPSQLSGGQSTTRSSRPESGPVHAHRTTGPRRQGKAGRRPAAPARSTTRRSGNGAITVIPEST